METMAENIKRVSKTLNGKVEEPLAEKLLNEKVEVEKKKIVMDTIKVAGGYEFEVKLYPEVSTKMKVIIVPQA